jgi:hypothetical protein
LSYKNKKEWALAKRKDWEDKRPAKQKLTKQVNVKGSKLYSVYVRTDDHDRMKAELEIWSVTSLRKFKKHSYLGVIKKVRDVVLFITKDGTYGLSKEQVNCLGDEAEEVLDKDYFSTPQKAINFYLKENTHDINWLKLKPPSTPETEKIDRMFSVEKYERKKLAVERLNKRFNYRKS